MKQLPLFPDNRTTPLQRRLICEACHRPCVTPVGNGRFLCERCQEEWWQALEQRWDAEARALGFASADERMEFERRGTTP